MKEETKCFGAEREVRKADETGGGGGIKETRVWVLIFASRR